MRYLCMPIISRDEVADDDVFLEAAERVGGAGDGGVREDPRGLLEGGRGEEGVDVERGAGDAKEEIRRQKCPRPPPAPS